MATEIAMSPDLPTPSLARRITSGLTVLGLTLFLVTFVVPWVTGTAPWGGLGALSLLVPIAVLTLGGGIGWILTLYLGTDPGIKNDNTFFSGLQLRGLWGWIAGIAFTAFYVVLYWFPAVLEGPIRLMDPVAMAITGHQADQWFLYGTLYTVLVLVFGLRMAYRYRHNRYQLIRTGSVSFFQLGFAWLIPHFLARLHAPEYYATYFWPLKPEYAYPPAHGGYLFDAGVIGTVMVVISAVMILVVTPVLTYFYGKRWYCSWVCGCGGLAETLGDPWRHLSDKSVTAWRIERISIYAVLVFVVLTTGLLWLDWALGSAVLSGVSEGFRSWYGFLIGAAFSGVIGVGFYPLLGSRVWCRFGCPMAALLGLQQRFFSRFRITTNGGQCISCGNCSTYCEMGIDVRAYAQREENIIRASCVGCGICAAVCPRGVLKLENGPVGDRYDHADKPLTAILEALGQPPLGELRSREE